MSEPTGTKRRRTGARTSSRTTSRNEESQGPSFSDLNALIAQAVEMAKLVKPTSADDAAVQQARTLTNSLLNALPGPRNGEDTLQSLGYESHKRLFETSVRGLQKHIANDPIDGWEEQGEMAEEIGNSIIDWLAQIWQKMADEDIDLGVIEKCLVVCSRAIDGMYSGDCRIDLSDLEPSATITDTKGNIVCDEACTTSTVSSSLSQAMVWIWRELLVTAASRKQPTKSILESIRRSGVFDEVFALIPKGKKKTNSEGNAFWDGHWTDAMKEAATKVCLARR